MDAAGWRVETGRPSQGGWPLSATLAVPDLRIETDDPVFPGGFRWTAETVSLVLTPARPRSLRVAASGRQTLRAAGWPLLDIDAAAVTADLSDHLDFAMREARVGPAGTLSAGPQGQSGARIGSLRLRASRQGGAHTAFTAEAADIGLPSTFGWPLGGMIAAASASGDLHGDVPPGSGVRARATAWRDDAGTLNLDSFGLTWGKLIVNGAARLTLDQALQPAGEATVRLNGWSEALDHLVQGEALPAREGRTARAVLSLLAAGNTDAVSLPLTLRNRTLSTRALPIARLPILDWPTP